MSEIDSVEPIENTGDTEGSLTDEINSLGKNLVGVLRTAWNRPERQRLQREIEGGLSELSSTLRQEARSIADSSVSQRIKSDVDDLNYRLRSRELESKVRDELVNALKVVNTELQKVITTLAAAESDQENVEKVDEKAPIPENQSPERDIQRSLEMESTFITQDDDQTPGTLAEENG
jgi:hypothetical protein